MSPSTEGRLAPLLDLVRGTDRDRYLATLYAPEDKRQDLLSLYAFNAEIAGIRDRVSQALPGEIRLQWWRDAFDANDPQAAAGHPVAEALLQAIHRWNLPVQAFQNYLDARIFDLYDDPMPTRGDLEGYCGETAAAVIQLSALVLDRQAALQSAETAGHAGCALATCGLLRLLPLHRRRGQCYIPKDLLAAAGTSPEEFIAGDGGPNAPRAVVAMIALAREHLAAFEKGAKALPESLRPAFLPLAPVGAQLAKMQGREKDMLAASVDISAWRKQWLLFRRASKGWA
ncbi:MAG: phytoene/squalene synthase family protein [Mesorhizobium sp.]|nr:phytoene/squalene synthase family protein [Mesorhizobium sp.]MBL8578587.1 phytoene/squalene synthase family protein [Mesorhizobium sp.]